MPNASSTLNELIFQHNVLW